MLDIILFASFTLLILSSSFLMGLLIQKVFKWDFTNYFNLPLGFAFILGILNLFVYVFVYLRVESIYFFALIGVIVFLPFVLGTFYLKPKFKLSLSLALSIELVLMIGIILFRLYIIYSRSLGEESFDTLNYLSYILEAAKGTTLTDFTITGVVRTRIRFRDDFTSYYYVLALLYRIIEAVKTRVQMDVYTLTIPSILWIAKVVYVTLSVSFSIATLKVLKVTNRLSGLAILILIHFFYGSFYYNSVFAFYGNTYRTLFAGVLLFVMFDAFKHKYFSMPHAIGLSILSSAMIAVNASGYFISFFALYVYVMIQLFRGKQENKHLFSVFIIFFPAIQFAISYFNVLGMYSQNAMFLLTFAYVLVSIAVRFIRVNLYQLFKISFGFVLPIILVVYSLIIHMDTPLFMEFFVSRSYTDMIWDYLSFNTLHQYVLNSLLWFAMVVFTWKNRTQARFYFLFSILLFFNPITYAFIVTYMNYDLVFQRGYDAIFNPYTVILFMSLIFSLIEKYKVLQVALLTITIVLAYSSTTVNYHYYFDAKPNYSGYNRLQVDQLQVFEVLNTIIKIEDYDRARVMSQIISVKGFVPNVFSIIEYNKFWSIDRYSEERQESFSPLWNIFIPREYYDQPIFSDKPNYERTCTYLIDRTIDFVIVDQTQFYIDDNGDFVPLYIRVRECATEVYRNERYILYQFYWK